MHSKQVNFVSSVGTNHPTYPLTIHHNFFLPSTQPAEGILLINYKLQNSAISLFPLLLPPKKKKKEKYSEHSMLLLALSCIS